MKQRLQVFRFRKAALAVADAIIIAMAGQIANDVLLVLHKGISFQMLLISMMMSTVTCLLGLALCGAYNKLWRYFRAKDYLTCVYGVLMGIIISGVFTCILRGAVPFAYVCLHTVISIAGICTFRFVFKRTFIDLTNAGRREAKQYKRTMIIGGGQACSTLLREIRNAQSSPYSEDKTAAGFEPVCIIDDDVSKLGQRILGVQIVGTTAEIEKYIQEFEVEQIVFCIPSCLEDVRKRILERCASADVPVKVIPFIGSLLFDASHTTLLGQVRDIRVEDLLGREPIKFDNEEVKAFISGKVCMVTGGGGSIGSELVRQIAKYDPKQIIIVDICENYAYDIQQELIETYGRDLNLIVRIASVRDYYRMNQLFSDFRPQVVFHAAAHKHVPLMEESPMEAIKNNVLGTFNVASLAQFHNVQKFVMISTDKAVNPTNCMGASKRCCEMIVQYLSKQPGTKTEFVTTRFGNVLGSNGSVIPKFRRQIENGQPVTVTHPDIIRYFMTIPEAVSLVMEAAAIAHGGEIFVLDMGKPVRIVTLAENLIRMYGKVPYKDVEIKFVGLRPGEKIKEELLMDEEGLQKTANKLIYIGSQIEIDADSFAERLRILRDAAEENNEAIAVSALHDMVPTFITPEEFNKMELEKHQKEEAEKTESNHA